jgi:hypothetical protein
MPISNNHPDWGQVKELIGRPPKGLNRIVKRHSTKGHPQVIEVLPFVDGAPFPTLFWMTCPILKREIGRVEATGIIKELEEELLSKPEFFERLKNDHRRYREMRLKLFFDQGNSLDDLSQTKRPMLTETGIGGIADPHFIKCFHLHYAHHLADSNCIGEFLDREFQIDRFL